MAEQLCIRLSDDSDAVSAVILNTDGHLLRSLGRAPLASLAGLCEGRRTIVLVSPETIVGMQAAVPKASPARLRRMLPFSLEDHFAEDVEELQFASGDRLDSGHLCVSVVARAQLEAWLDRLRAAGIRPSAIHAASDGVPDTPTTTNLVLEGVQVMGRRPGDAPFVLESIPLVDMWTLLLEQREDSTDLQHVMVYADHEALAARRTELDALRERVTSFDVRELADGCLQRLGSTVVACGGTNLLQGDYAPRSNYRALVKPWAAAAGLVLGLVGVAIAADAIELVKLRHDDQALTEEATRICASSYSSRLLSSCRAEMQRRLSDAGQTAASGQDSFLATLAVVADAAAAGTAIEQLSYRDQVLSLDLIVPSVTELDSLSQRIEGSEQFEVRMLTNTPDEGGLKSRIQIVELIPLGHGTRT